MRKCDQCRELDKYLLTKWEIFVGWLFYKVNSILFTDDFKDYASQKYTQGFTDGSIEGVNSERIRLEREQVLYPRESKPTEDEINMRITTLLSNVDLTKIVSKDPRGLILIGGIHADNVRLTNLKAETEFLLQSELWTLLYETPKELAQRAMFINSESLDDMKKGKSILYTLSTQKNILNLFKDYIPK